MNAVSRPLLILAACLVCPAALASPPASAVFKNHQAKHLIGLKVENEDGISLGKLKNFVIDTSSSSVIYALVSSGGGLSGIGAQTKVVPASSFTPTTAKRGVTCVNIIQKKWEALPVYKKGDLPKLADYQHYRALFASVGVSFSPGQHAPALAPTGHSSSQSQTVSPSLVLATDLFGNTVADAQGQSVGIINDLLLDTSRDRPPIALTSTGTMLHRGQTLAIPLSSLKPAGKNKVSANIALTSLSTPPLLTPEIWARSSRQDSALYRFAAR
jgi:sporulation protein YlmC with PRC-barrel domain